MNKATHLTKFGIRFHGPQAPALFACHPEPEGFDHVVVGTGESRAVAAARALSHMRDLNVRTLMRDIEERAQRELTPYCTEIEAGDEGLNMYCVIGISVKRGDA